MGSKIENIVEATKAQAGVDENLTNIFYKYLEIESRKEEPGYQAWATYALDVCLILSNLFLSVKKPNTGRGYRSLCDLAYNLHANEFWMRNSAFLMPLVTVYLNAHKDHQTIKAEFKNTSEYATHDKVMAAAEYGFLDIFSAVLYLTGGPSLMAAASLPLKMDLAPYFLD